MNDNPLPWLTDRMRSAGVFRKQTEEVYDYRNQRYTDVSRTSDEAAAGLLTILSQVVTGLHDDDRPYTVVVNKDNASAGTLMEKKVVEIGSKPMHDKDLTEGQQAAVMAGLAAHEAAHIRYGRGWQGALTRHFGKDKVTPAIHTLSNLAADLHDEAEMVDYAPGIAPAIPITLWWVAGKGKDDTAHAPLDTVAGRIQAAIQVTRYADYCDFSDAPEWVRWWQDWAHRARYAHQPKVHAALVDEAIRKCRDVPPQPKQPKPEPTESGEGRGEDGGQQQASGPSTDDTEPQGEQPGEGRQQGEASESGAEGNGEGQGTEAGSESGSKSDQTSMDGGADDGSAGTGASAGDLSEPTSDEYRQTWDDPCVVDKSRSRLDGSLQSSAEREWRGKREGMRRRTYHHKVSHFGGYGRTVTTLGWKGGRWSGDV